jgi:hypothetical protein
VTLETIWHYRRMLGNPRYKTVGLIGTPFFFVSEALAPLFEVLAAASLTAAFVLGLFDWRPFIGFIVLMAFANGLLATAGVWLEDAVDRSYRCRHLVLLIALGPLELLLYRPILAWARLKGTVGFMRRDRGWGRFDRNDRGVQGSVGIAA